MNLQPSPIDAAIDQQVRKIDDLILSRLSEHIPGITRQNVGDYAHRLSRVTVAGQEYPIRIYLDTDILILEQLEPTMSQGTDEQGNFTVTMNQLFR